MKTRTLATLGAAVVGFALLSGCSKATPTVTVGTLDEPTASAEAKPAMNEAAKPDTAAAGDVTAPGTTLAVGDDATVDYRIVTFPNGLDADPVTSPSGDLMMRVSVSSATPAAVSDLPKGTIITGTTEAELSVVKVTYEVQATGTPAFSMERRSVINDFSTVGYNSFMFFDDTDIAGCANPVNLGTEFDAGQTIEGCFLVAFLTSAGAPGIEFGPPATELYDSPLVWTLA